MESMFCYFIGQKDPANYEHGSLFDEQILCFTQERIPSVGCSFFLNIILDSKLSTEQSRLHKITIWLAQLT